MKQNKQHPVVGWHTEIPAMATEARGVMFFWGDCVLWDEQIPPPQAEYPYFRSMNLPARKDARFVGIQLLLFVLYGIPVRIVSFSPGELGRYVGWGLGMVGLLIIALALLQLNRNLSPFPTPRESGTLIQTGLYKFVRHPIYSGIILAAIGLGCALGSGWKIGVGLALWGLFFAKSTYEEQLLARRFPDYEAYKQTTGRFFPFL